MAGEEGVGATCAEMVLMSRKRRRERRAPSWKVGRTPRERGRNQGSLDGKVLAGGQDH